MVDDPPKHSRPRPAVLQGAISTEAQPSSLLSVLSSDSAAGTAGICAQVTGTQHRC